jgi:hypothetical protein
MPDGCSYLTLQKGYEEAVEWSKLGGHHTPYAPKRVRD